MKKLVSVLLAVVIVFNFILCNKVYADYDTPESNLERYGGNGVISPEAVKMVAEEGKDTNGNSFKFSNFGPSIIGVSLQYIGAIINSLPMALQGIMTLLTVNPENSGEDDSFLVSTANMIKAIIIPEYRFTINRTVFNEVALFNINVFNMEDTYVIGIGETETINQSQAIIKLKESTAGWFYTCRLIAIMLNAIMLIYVGIRMALSTIATEEAKYKKMLIDWAASIVIIFLLPYIMSLIIGIGNIMENIMFSIRKSVMATGGESFEESILQSIYWAFEYEGGISFFLYCLFFWFLTFIQGKFFFAYFKRTLSVFFLTIIAPFITITYPIDKMGDGKAQAFEAWTREYLINVIIQPIHAAIYIIFVFTAGKIAEKAPFVAMIFLLTLGRVENIIRNIFGITNSVSMRKIETAKMGKKG